MLTEVFGDLGQRPDVVATLQRQLRSLDEQGRQSTLFASLAHGDVRSPTCSLGGDRTPNRHLEVNDLAVS